MTEKLDRRLGNAAGEQPAIAIAGRLCYIGIAYDCCPLPPFPFGGVGCGIFLVRAAAGGVRRRTVHAVGHAGAGLDAAPAGHTHTHADAGAGRANSVPHAPAFGHAHTYAGVGHADSVSYAHAYARRAS